MLLRRSRSRRQHCSLCAVFALRSVRMCVCVCVGERVSLAYGGCDSRCFAIGTQESSACVCVSACAGFACVCVCAACCFWRKKKQTVAAAFFSTAQIAQLAAGCNRALMCVCVYLCMRVCAYSAGQAYRKNWLTLCFSNMFPKKLNVCSLLVANYKSHKSRR